jgi:4-amino-4-deoxy-L-arabinose transferase-like glycosyltransferase
LVEISLYDKVLTAFLALLLVMIGIQGIIYPPNNWDSMTYHMARIASWVSHETVYHYPTHILRQIYQPPFAEYVIMHFNLLSKSDYFANSVQLIFLLFSIISVLLIIERLGINRKFRILAVVLIVTIPMVILQASSTQNDIVISFFVLSAYYFSLKAVKAPSLQNYFLAGLTLGLGLLTKGTGYLYFAPVMLYWGITALKQVFITKDYRHISYFAVTLLVFIIINSGFITVTINLIIAY